MALSSKQTALHWRLWAKVLEVQGWRHLTPPEQTAKRHATYRLALRTDKSLTAFNNGDFDRVLATFKTLIDPLNIDAQIDVRGYEDGVDPGLRDRLIWAIWNKYGFGPAYIEKVCLAKFDGQWKVDALTLPQLQELRLTLQQRARSRDRKAKQATAPTVPDDNCPY